MIVPRNNDYLTAQCPIRHWLTFNKKLQPTSNWGQVRKDCITEFGHTYILSVAAFQTSSYILRWGSPMTCNKKIWTWRRRRERKWESLHALEKRAWKCGVRVIEWEKSNIYIEKKSCNRAHVKRKNSNDLNILLFQCCCKNFFLCSHFLPFYLLHTRSCFPLNVTHIPTSS